MKKSILLSVLFTLIAVNFSAAQDIKVHNFVGKNINEAISYYGKPVHQDNSTPEMISTFFQLPNRSYIFISNGDSVYQAQATITYASKEDADKSISVFINECIQNEFVSDTLGVEKFRIHKVGNSIEAEMDALSNGKYQVKIVARKTED